MIHTRKQCLMQKAYVAVKKRAEESKNASAFKKDYVSFAQSFPALIHGVGSCQAVAFANAKAEWKQEDQSPTNDFARVLTDLTTLLGLSDGETLPTTVRTCSAFEYMRMTRLALEAATLLKWYAEAFENDYSFEETNKELIPSGAGS